MTASSPQKASSKRKTKATVKRAKNAKSVNHPKFIDMIGEALQKLNEKSGSSRQAILKFVVANYPVDEKLANQYLKVALKNGVKSGVLKQLKGVGASGSFKLADKAAKSKRQSQVKPKIEAKPAEKKSTVKKAASKKTVTKEAAAAKLPAAPKTRKPPTVREQVVAKKSRTKKSAAPTSSTESAPQEKKAESTETTTTTEKKKADSDKQVRVSARKAAEAKSKKAAISTRGKKKDSEANETAQA